jgi:ribulose-5-phosphate 4-epimerase/fuculose-1-phosphate aldolase
MTSDREAKQQVIQITNELFSLGLMTATGGNVSALAGEEGTIWITPSRMYKGGLEERDLVRIDGNCNVLEGERPASVEWQMHFSSYAARPGSTGAVHTHAPIATAFGITNQSFPPLNTDAIFLRDTVTVPWLMPGSKELADAVGEALGKSRSCILQNHGLMTVGKDLRDAATRAMILEETAKIVLYVKQFGGEVSVIPPDWVEQLAQLANFI